MELQFAICSLIGSSCEVHLTQDLTHPLDQVDLNAAVAVGMVNDHRHSAIDRHVELSSLAVEAVKPQRVAAGGIKLLQHSLGGTGVQVYYGYRLFDYFILLSVAGNGQQPGQQVAGHITLRFGSDRVKVDFQPRGRIVQDGSNAIAQVAVRDGFPLGGDDLDGIDVVLVQDQTMPGYLIGDIHDILAMSNVVDRG